MNACMQLRVAAPLGHLIKQINKQTNEQAKLSLNDIPIYVHANAYVYVYVNTYIHTYIHTYNYLEHYRTQRNVSRLTCIWENTLMLILVYLPLALSL